jgi:nicotinamide-nucleotide amidase
VFNEAILTLATEVVETGTAKGLTVGTAESCTGGLVCAALTEVSGSSAVVQGGVCSYALDIKEKILGVKHQTLLDHGAVSSECVLEMVAGAREALDADVCVSVSGIAGPTGAVPGKPVGTVWFAIGTPRASRSSVRHFDGDRDAVRTQSVEYALSLIRDALMEL